MATVGRPMARQVRTTRTAISPRFATRTLRKRPMPSAHPARLALLQEGPHPLLCFRRSADVGDALDGVALDVLDAPPGTFADEGLRLGDGPRPGLQQLLNPSLDSGVEVLFG